MVKDLKLSILELCTKTLTLFQKINNKKGKKNNENNFKRFDAPIGQSQS